MGQPLHQPLTPASAPQMFKGPDQDIEFIYTAPSTAVCGRLLDTGGKKEYLIAGEHCGGGLLRAVTTVLALMSHVPRKMPDVCLLPGHILPLPLLLLPPAVKEPPGCVLAVLSSPRPWRGQLGESLCSPEVSRDSAQ